jgi:hypothetical protein
LSLVYYLIKFFEAKANFLTGYFLSLLLGDVDRLLTFLLDSSANLIERLFVIIVATLDVSAAIRVVSI